jgi:hypothetical protein
MRQPSPSNEHVTFLSGTDHDMWYIGQKVICINADGPESPLRLGAELTISCIEPPGLCMLDKTFVKGLLFHEIPGPPMGMTSYDIRRFRPADPLEERLVRIQEEQELQEMPALEPELVQ